MAGRGRRDLHTPPSGSPVIYAPVGGSIVRILVPPLHKDTCFSYKKGVQREDGLDSSAYIIHPYLLIRAEAHADSLDEFLDGLLGPLQAHS